MTDDKFDPDESHFSDEELEAALAGFEKEFADDSVSGDASDTSDADKTADAASAKSDSDANDDTADKASADSGQPMTDDVTGSVADAVNEAMADVVDPSLGFDNELAGLLGNKAKVALIVTRLASAELLAAFCQLSDISAACIGANQGAVAVLKNLNGEPGSRSQGPDHRGIRHGVILAVNRADKLEVAMYVQGEAGQSFAPPVLFTSTPRFVEDLMLGIVTLNQLKTQGFEVVDSAGLDHDQAMQILANHTRRGRGGRGSRIE